MIIEKVNLYKKNNYNVWFIDYCFYGQKLFNYMYLG